MDNKNDMTIWMVVLTSELNGNMQSVKSDIVKKIKVWIRFDVGIL